MPHNLHPSSPTPSSPAPAAPAFLVAHGDALAGSVGPFTSLVEAIASGPRRLGLEAGEKFLVWQDRGPNAPHCLTYQPINSPQIAGEWRDVIELDDEGRPKFKEGSGPTCSPASPSAREVANAAEGLVDYLSQSLRHSPADLAALWQSTEYAALKSLLDRVK